MLAGSILESCVLRRGRLPLRAALAVVHHPDAELPRLVGEVVGDAGAGEHHEPIGRTSSKRSLRLKGAALPSRVQSGLKAICVTLRLLAQQGACRVRCTPRDRTGGVRSTMIAGGLAHLSKDAQFAERGGVDWQGTEFPNSVLAKKRALLDGDGSH